MKISEITVDDVAKYLRLDDLLEDATEKIILEKQLTPIMAASKTFISKYTGIKIAKDNDTDEEETIDDYDDFYIVFMALCQDMYDNRTMYVDKSNVSKVVAWILNMHCKNLI